MGFDAEITSYVKTYLLSTDNRTLISIPQAKTKLSPNVQNLLYQILGNMQMPDFRDRIVTYNLKTNTVGMSESAQRRRIVALPPRIELVDDQGQKRAVENARVGRMTEAEVHLVDKALIEVREIENARVAQMQNKPGNEQQKGNDFVTSSTESTNAQAVAPTKKAKRADSVGTVGARRETEAARHGARIQEQQQAGKRRKAANEALTEQRRENKARINKEVRKENIEEEQLKHSREKMENS